MRKAIIGLLVLCMSQSLSAQQNIRPTKGWEFLKEDLGSVWEAVRPAAPGSPQSVPVWDSVTLPHCFNERDAVDPDVNYYEGPGWYRTQLAIHNPYKNGRTLLHFEGAGQKTTVYVYQQQVGHHIGGYDEWTVDITDAVKSFLNSPDSSRFKGKIPIEVRCDNSRDVQMIPSDMADFTIYGGLYRYVDLRYVPAVSLGVLHIHPIVDAKGKMGTVEISASLNNPDHIRDATLELNILDPGGKVIKTFSKDLQVWDGLKQVFSFSLKKPVLWSPEHPALYTLKAKLVTGGETESRDDHFGFRHFEFITHGPFMLNGKRLLLRGTHRHEDQAGVGAAETEGMIRREFTMIKNMGANFIRLAHYQQSPIVLHLCDSLGLLVWEELPWNRGGLGGKAYKRQARQMLTDMITQHYNHPSVIIWSLANEIDWPGDFPTFSKDSIRHFLKVLNDLAHHLDPDRMTAIRRCDFCSDLVDVYSPSIWAGWYSGRYTEYRSSTEKQIKRVNHFFHAEWGADAHARRHAEDPYKNIGGVPTGKGVAEKTGDAALTGGKARVSRDGDWSETYQCDLIDWYLKEQETMPRLTGSAYWIFKDFATPLRPDNPVPYVNEKGVVTRDLKPKASYYVFQSYWAKKPMVHIYGHTWPVRWGADGKKETIKVYSNCNKAELFVNGKSYGIKKRNSQDFPAAGLRWEVPMHKGTYKVRVAASNGNTILEDSISFQYQTQKWGRPQKLLLKTLSNNNDTTTVEAIAEDARGVRCLDAANFVRFSLAGDGKLIDDLGTSDGSRKVQLYNGRAIIRVKNNHGKSAIGVKSDGLESSLFLLDAD
ncbi:MAG TPA: glycoside hydrolase family 2 TIM barrel-domain containing protein [Chitinophagaceae bacterium]|nr:glycoside hydrolase family 2 TIM barrel-domain containing protein [Chitinophagaceae bacterium]